MKYRFYITDSNPNGTHGLVITDEDGQVLDYIDEAVFGFSYYCMSSPLMRAMFFDDSVGAYPSEDDEQDMLEDNTLWQVDIDDVLARIACSPVSDGSEIVTQLKQYA